MNPFDTNQRRSPELFGTGTAPLDPAPSKITQSLSPRMSACLQRGGLVLTGNARAARALGAAYAATQRQNGLEAWAAPQIADWSAFLDSLWNQLLLNAEDAPLLLSTWQEHEVWKDIADRHGDARLVVSMDGMAKLAQSGYALLRDYEAHAALRRSWAYAGSRDAEAFRDWARTFDELCATERWLSHSGLAELAAESIKAGKLVVPREILLIGFDRMMPSQQRLLAALESRDTSVSQIEGAGQTPTAIRQVLEAKDRSEEIAACASWARRVLVAAPASRIGIFVQDGTAARSEMERVFRQALLPGAIGIDAAPVIPPYEFSLGRPLASVPVVRMALLLLRWFNQTLTQEEVSWLLLSGFIAEGPGQMLSTAQIDASMRQRESTGPDVSLDWWLSHSSRYLNSQQSSAEARGLGSRLLHAQRKANQNIRSGERRAIRNSERAYSEWVDIATELLSIAGWPGPETEDSAQFQARRKFDQMMDSIAALSFKGKRVDYPGFIATLSHTSAETIFQPQSRNAPIQIMGPMEAAGQDFDACWFLGVDDRHWPVKAAAHPLLPIQMQREYKMPHAEASGDWDLAVQVTQRVAASAPECLCSYAKQLPDGAVALSPVVEAAFPRLPKTVQAATLLDMGGAAYSTTQRLQTVETVDISSILWPTAVTAGGTEILKMQAACPFKAFATRRLGAGDLNKAERGLSAKDRGIILHGILQNIWSGNNEPQWRLHTYEDLIGALADGRISSIISHHVRAFLTKREDLDDAWQTAYLANEKERLCILLAEWLAKEAERHPFEVEACERKLVGVQVGELKLNLRIDRIDKLSAGGRLLIDYKTGKVTKAAWDGERPDEPQLPLYAAFGDTKNLQGVLYAQLRANELAFVGRIADSKHIFQKALGKGSSTESYNVNIQQEWAVALLSLAKDFIDGDASVTPKKYPKTCEQCPLPTLCRVADTPVPVAASAIDEPEFDYASAEARYE